MAALSRRKLRNGMTRFLQGYNDFFILQTMRAENRGW
jgi:hypothetical protein